MSLLRAPAPNMSETRQRSFLHLAAWKPRHRRQHSRPSSQHPKKPARATMDADEPSQIKVARCTCWPSRVYVGPEGGQTPATTQAAATQHQGFASPNLSTMSTSNRQRRVRLPSNPKPLNQRGSRMLCKRQGFLQARGSSPQDKPLWEPTYHTNHLKCQMCGPNFRNTTTMKR